MPTRQRFTGLAAVTSTAAAMLIVSQAVPAGAAPAPAFLRLPGSVAPFTSQSQVIGSVAGATPLTIQVWMRPAHQAAAQRFAMAVSTPGSGIFHRYLGPDAYTARFGASKVGTRAVESWLRAQGFMGIQADAQRNYVRATGKVALIEAAFKTQLEDYRSSAAVSAGPYQLRANSAPIAIPRSLSRYVIGVTGLDNVRPKLPLLRGPRHRSGTAKPKPQCSHFYGQHSIAGLPAQFGRTTFPTQTCGYTAQQLRGAYGISAISNGQGQTVSLVELGLVKDMFLTLKDQAASERFQAPSRSRYSELSLGKRSCGNFNIEEQLDVEVSYDLAPGANQLVIGGDSCDNGDSGFQGLFNADIVNIDGIGGVHRPLSTISSNSWGPGNDLQPAADTAIMHAYLVRAAAQGVGMYFASGDSSGVETPDDSFAILVGGTTLGIGQGSKRLFEAGWSSGLSSVKKGKWVLGRENGATSGGPSLLFAEPSYQRGVVPRALATAPGDRPGLVRSEPDISADADLFTGFATGILTFPQRGAPKLGKFTVGGTSMAAPLIAGIIADAQQGQPKSFGFTNPVFYQLHGTAAFTDILPSTSHTPSLFRGEVCTPKVCGHPTLVTFDDQNPHLRGYTGQVTLKGYDNMTGIGTPHGQTFINTLRKAER